MAEQTPQRPPAHPPLRLHLARLQGNRTRHRSAQRTAATFPPVDPSKFKLIGKNYITQDLMAKVTGRAKYAEDYRAEGMLFVKLMLSPRPHARVVNIDASRALAMPGVHAVLTADDMPPPPPPPAGPPPAAGAVPSAAAAGGVPTAGAAPGANAAAQQGRAANAPPTGPGAATAPGTPPTRRCRAARSAGPGNAADSRRVRAGQGSDVRGRADSRRRRRQRGTAPRPRSKRSTSPSSRSTSRSIRSTASAPADPTPAPKATSSSAARSRPSSGRPNSTPRRWRAASRPRPKPASTTVWGDVEKGFAEADVVVEHTSYQQSTSHQPLESRTAMAYWQNGKLYLHGSTQSVSRTIASVAGWVGSAAHRRRRHQRVHRRRLRQQDSGRADDGDSGAAVEES